MRWNSSVASRLARGTTSRLPASGVQVAISSAASQPPGSLPWTPPSTITRGPSTPLWVTVSGVSHSVPAISARSMRACGGTGRGAGSGGAAGTVSAALNAGFAGAGVGTVAAGARGSLGELQAASRTPSAPPPSRRSA